MGILDFMTGGGEYADPNALDPRYGVSKGDVRQAALNTLGNVSGLLLAAGQPMSGSQRAQILGQLGPAFGGAQTDIYNAAQRRLLGAENEQKMAQFNRNKAFAERQKTDPEGLAKELGIPVETVIATPADVLMSAYATRQSQRITMTPLEQAKEQQTLQQNARLQDIATRQKTDPAGLARDLGISPELAANTAPEILLEGASQRQLGQITANPLDAELKQLQVEKLREEIRGKKGAVNSVLKAYGLPLIGGDTTETPTPQNAVVSQGGAAPKIPEIGAQPVFPTQDGQPPPPQGKKLALDPATVQQLIAGGASPADIAKLEIDAQARLDAAAATKEAAKTKSDIDQENKLTADAEPLVNKYIERQTAYTTMEELAMAGEGASDVALLISMFKIYDPTSTVTGGESQTLQGAAGVPEQFLGLWNNLRSAGPLSQKQREDIVRAGRARMDQEVEAFGNTYDRFTKKANLYGLNPERVITDVRDPRLVEDFNIRKERDDISKKILVREIFESSADDLAKLNPTYMSAKQKQAIDARLKQLEEKALSNSQASRFRPFSTAPVPVREPASEAGFFSLFN